MFDRATWKAVAIGVVATAIGLYIVDPLLKYLPSMVIRVSGAISEGWTNSIFREAAQPRSAETLILLLFGLLLAVGVLQLLPTPTRSDPARAARALRWDKTFRALMAGNSLLVSLAILVLVLQRATSTSLESCFHSRVTVLSPHLSDREAKELSASWTLMQNRADYDAIRGRMKQYAEKYNVVPVIKSLEATQQRRCI